MAKANEAEWRIVTRRKKNTTPADPLPTPSPPAPNTTTTRPAAYKPYHTSYADIVRTEPPISPRSTTHPKQPITNLTKPITNPNQRSTGAYYISPHSAAQLRFPPSPRYVEWKGRCFQCCGMGHSATRCKNLKRCGRCWGQGHTGNLCKNKVLNQTSLVAPMKFNNIQKEPSFEEVLQGQLPPISLPVDRPKKIVCFVERDEKFYEERAKLDKAVVMYNPSLEVDLSVDQVAEYAASSGLVKTSEISVGIMTRSRYIILLPMGIDPAKFIRAIPSDVWEEGFSFSLWSPLDDAIEAMPCYKVMLDLIGIPPDLYREQYVIRATSAIGTYLGTVEQVSEGDVACWTVVLATTSLSLIPQQVSYRVGGLEFPVDVIPRACSQGEVYKENELPQPKEKFHAPAPRPTSPSSFEGSSLGGEEDQFIGSRKVLQQLCRNIEFELLPTGVQAVLRGASSMTVSPADDHGSQRLHDPITKNPIEEDPVLPVTDDQQAIPDGDTLHTKNQGVIIEVDTIHTENQGIIIAADLAQTIIEELREVRATGSGDQMEEEVSVENQVVCDQRLNTPIATNSALQATLSGNDDCIIDIQVQAIPITAISPQSERNILIKEGSKFSENPPRILQRNNNRAIVNSQLGDNGTQHEILKEAHGPKIFCESTRQERKRLLLESTKLKRKQREQALKKEGKAEFFKTGVQPKAASFKEDGLVQIQVEFEHCSRIAETTGFQTSQVIMALNEDNAERALKGNHVEDANSSIDHEDNTIMAGPHSVENVDSDSE